MTDVRSMILSTDPIDKARAEHAIDRVLRTQQLTLGSVTWARSPLEMATVCQPRKKRDKLLAGTLEAWKWREGLRKYVLGGDGRWRWESSQEISNRSLADTLHRSLYAMLNDQRSTNHFRDAYSDFLLSPQNQQVNSPCELALVAGTTTFRCHEMPMQSTELLIAWREMAEETYWVSFFEDKRRRPGCYVDVVACERPVTLHVDDQDRLHNENGSSAIAFADGFRGHFVNGVFLSPSIHPEDWLRDPSKLDPERVVTERNAEVRAIMARVYGWDKLLQHFGARVVDHRRNDIDQTEESLVELGHEAGELALRKLLICACPSTAKVFTMRVPENIQTCSRAQAWLCDGERRGIRVIGAS